MPLLIALILAFTIGLVVRLQWKSQFLAWFLSSFVMPIFVLFDAFVLQYPNVAASMWPITLVIGSFVGSLVGGLGVVAASYYLKKKENSQPDA